MVRNLGAWNHHPTTTTNRLVLWLALLAYCRVAFHLSMARMLGSHGLLFFLVVAVSFLSFFPSRLLQLPPPPPNVSRLPTVGRRPTNLSLVPLVTNAVSAHLNVTFVDDS
jgi:hypothetical protein